MPFPNVGRNVIQFFGHTGDSKGGLLFCVVGKMASRESGEWTTWSGASSFTIIH